MQRILSKPATVGVIITVFALAAPAGALAGGVSGGVL
jgi:hypothetical protein